MRTFFSIGLMWLALVLLGTGALWAEETDPPPIEWDGAVVPPEISGVFNTMRVSTQDVRWDGNGIVSIPFTINQRGTVWLAVYEKGSTATGPRGPVGAWVRLQPQDLFVAVTAGQVVDAGSNTITWDGNDWEGNPAGAGNYEFDLVAINNLDKLSLAGPNRRWEGNAWTSTVIDVRPDPPEVWFNEFDRTRDEQHTGDVIHYKLGGDFLDNPLAWERWSYRNIFTWEAGRSYGGIRFDDVDPEIFWAVQSTGAGEHGGIYKIKINRAGKSWDSVTDFGDNGWAPMAEERIWAIDPWNEVVYASNWNRVENPVCTTQSWDKQSGALLREVPMNDFFTVVNEDGSRGSMGPGHMGVNEHGVWITAIRPDAPVVYMKHDGTVMWANRNGDVLGDGLSIEAAAALGVPVGWGSSVMPNPSGNGHVCFFSEVFNNRGSLFSAVGRDGSGLFEVFFATDVGPVRADRWALQLRIVDQGTRWDGLYHGSMMSIIDYSYEFAEDRYSPGPGMLLYIPYDTVSGRLGPGVTAVEEVERTSLPSSYSLSSAYPNPFNPETTIEFVVPAAADERVKLEVYNATGQLVATLVDEALSAGAYKTTWNGRDQQGDLVSSGLYFYRMQAADYVAARPVTLLK